MEKYTKTTRFCIICNYVNKIIPALQSRCTRFRFSPLAKENISQKLKDIAESEGANMTEDGLKAILHLSEGDMRRCLNILQACHMAYPEVNEKNVYLCTGNATPDEVRGGLAALLNSSFTEAFDCKVHFSSISSLLNVSADIQMLQVEKGFALSDMVRELHMFVLHMPDLPSEVLRYLLEKLAELEYDLSHETSQRLQLGALVSIFQVARVKTFELLDSNE
jgi:replication factor C subunit 3/5